MKKRSVVKIDPQIMGGVPCFIVGHQLCAARELIYDMEEFGISGLRNGIPSYDTFNRVFASNRTEPRGVSESASLALTRGAMRIDQMTCLPMALATGHCVVTMVL